MSPAANQARLELEALEVDDDNSMLLPSIVLSMVPSRSLSSAIHHLQSAVHVLQEDISWIQRQFVSRELLYLEEIAELKSKLNVGSSKSKGRK